MRTHLPSIALLLLTACGGASTTTTAPITTGRSTATLHPEASLERGLERMRSGDCRAALSEDFGPLVEESERRFQGQILKASRLGTFALGVVTAVASTEGNRAPAFVVVSSDHPDTIYFAAYCAIELGDLALGERYLMRALAIMENDPAYLSELGHVQQTRRDFDKALETFTRAESSVMSLAEADAASTISFLGHDLPWWHRRTLRGMGFSLIELGRLDEAEVVYDRVLAIEPSDEQARTELRLIDELRTRARANTL